MLKIDLDLNSSIVAVSHQFSQMGYKTVGCEPIEIPPMFYFHVTFSLICPFQPFSNFVQDHILGPWWLDWKEVLYVILSEAPLSSWVPIIHT